MLRTEKTTKIKPCPFCGQEGAGAHYDHGYWSVTCGYRHDGAPGGHCFQDWGEFETEKEAVEAWNHRAGPPNPPLTLDELREMDGEPVWLEWGGHPQTGWALVRVWLKAENIIYLTYFNGSTDSLQLVMKCGGKIYRRRPEAGPAS